ADDGDLGLRRRHRHDGHARAASPGETSVIEHRSSGILRCVARLRRVGKDAPETPRVSAGVIEMDPALWVRRGDPPTMDRPHRHDDLEVNVVLRGRLDYLFGGSRVSVEAG